MENLLEEVSMEHSTEILQHLSYRDLQQKAKALRLPCTVKKVYLIQMIVAAQYQSKAELDDIIHEVQLDRQQRLRANRKKKKGRKKPRVQGAEISSTYNHTPERDTQSPIEIDWSTPPRSSEIIPRPRQIIPKSRADILGANQQQSINISNHPQRQAKNESVVRQMMAGKMAEELKNQHSMQLVPSTSSDRVLRSCNVKSYKKPNYCLMHDSLMGVIKEDRKRATHLIRNSTPDGKYKLDATERCVMKKVQNNVEDRGFLKLGNQLVPAYRNLELEHRKRMAQQMRNSTPDSKYPKLDATERCVMKKIQNNVVDMCYLKLGNRLIPAYRNLEQKSSRPEVGPPATKCQRSISGFQRIPQTSQNQSRENDLQCRTIRVRGANAEDSKINAVVHKLRNAQNIKTEITSSTSFDKRCHTGASSAKQQYATIVDKMHKISSKTSTVTMKSEGIIKIKQNDEKNNNSYVVNTISGRKDAQPHRKYLIMQDLINCNIDVRHSYTKSSMSSSDLDADYPNLTAHVEEDVSCSQDTVHISQAEDPAAEEDMDTDQTESAHSFTDYCHKKIKAKQTNVSIQREDYQEVCHESSNQVAKTTCHQEENQMDDQAGYRKENQAEADHREVNQRLEAAVMKQLEDDRLIVIQGEHQPTSSFFQQLQLPSITNVFPNIKHRPDLMKPLYVHLDEEKAPSYYPNSSTSILESLYNFKRSFIVNAPFEPLLKTTAATTCVYSAPRMSSSISQLTPISTNDYFEKAYQYDQARPTSFEADRNLPTYIISNKTRPTYVKTDNTAGQSRPMFIVTDASRPAYAVADQSHNIYDVIDQIPYVKTDDTRPTYVVTEPPRPSTVLPSNCPSYVPADQNIPTYAVPDQSNLTYGVPDQSNVTYGVPEQICQTYIKPTDDIRSTYLVADQNLPTYAIEDQTHTKYLVPEQSSSGYVMTSETRPTCVVAEPLPYVVKDQNCPSYVVENESHPSFVLEDQARPAYEVPDQQLPQYDVESEMDAEDWHCVALPAEQNTGYQDASQLANSTDMEVDRSFEEDMDPNLPAMVKDALEIISQDGDYMERIEMDVKMHCIFCAWAGPKVILEYHIRKEHSEQIVKHERNEWVVTYRLGSLVQQDQWLSQVMEYEGALYALSVKYQDPEMFMAAVSMITPDPDPKSGSVTIYNKVTGEPYMWRGQIPQLHPDMPYDNVHPGLQLKLSYLNLLPNRENMKLLNRELVTQSPCKVVVGTPELNDIQITMFVKIFY